MKKIKKLAFLACILLITATACSSNPKVTRVDADTQIDLSGYWNDVDVRKVCNSLINDCLTSPRVNNTISSMRKTPVVLVGNFYNDSSEHIDTSIISTTMENAIFNSGKLDFVAGGRVRDQLRAEKQDQQTQASVESAVKLGRELGANFLMTGSVKVMNDSAGNKTVRTYFVTAELTNIETGKRMWMGQNNEIKKVVERRGSKF
jgi:uncharacterized protein (TIGR02722 family)